VVDRGMRLFGLSGVVCGYRSLLQAATPGAPLGGGCAMSTASAPDGSFTVNPMEKHGPHLSSLLGDAIGGPAESVWANAEAR
jgi:hypothetical protein